MFSSVVTDFGSWTTISVSKSNFLTHSIRQLQTSGKRFLRISLQANASPSEPPQTVLRKVIDKGIRKVVFDAAKSCNKPRYKILDIVTSAQKVNNSKIYKVVVTF